MRFLFAALVICFTGLATTPAAQGHARVVRSEPARAAEVTTAPRQLDIWFNELLENGFNHIAVFPASELGSKTRSNLAKDKPVVDPRDRTHLTVPLRVLAPGEYIVEWRVLSRDGHTAPGRFTFRVR